MKAELRDGNSNAKSIIYKILWNDLQTCIHLQTAYKPARYLFFLDKSYCCMIPVGPLGGQGDLQDWYV